MSDCDGLDPPSPFIAQWAARFAPARRDALDVAVGHGRHLVALAALGLRTFGVDRSFDAAKTTVRLARARGYRPAVWCADLTTMPLPSARFDLIVVARYLQRDLFPSIAEALRPGGILLYETFTTRQLAHGRGPTSPHHLLRPGELTEVLPSLECVFYEEVDEPDALARLVARRP